MWRAERNEPELRLVRDLLVPGETLIDVGANSGIYVLAGTVAGAAVVAVEPQHELATRLRERWPASSVRVIESAISSDVGSATLYRPIREDGRILNTRSSLAENANPGFDTVSEEVPTTTIDALCAGIPSVCVLKVDVEGLESAVLHSASDLLDTQHPTVLVEVEQRHHNHGDPWEPFSFLATKGYQGWFPDGRRRLENLAKFDPAVHQPCEIVKDPRSSRAPAGYVNNFLFIHPANATKHKNRLRQRWSLA